MDTFQLILLGAAIALYPLPLSAYILLLGSKNGVRKGLGYTLGWVVVLAVICYVTIVVTGPAPPRSHTAPSTALLVVQILAGTGLLILAWRQRGRVRTTKPKPKWQQNLDRVGMLGAAGISFLLQPWLSIAAGAAAASQSDRIGPVVAFGLLASSTYLVMQAFATIRPQETTARLQGLDQWIDDHHNGVLIVLYVALGLWLIAKAATALS
jgi:Sap, sulfolipid-1-addressing protein